LKEHVRNNDKNVEHALHEFVDMISNGDLEFNERGERIVETVKINYQDNWGLKNK